LSKTIDIVEPFVISVTIWVLGFEVSFGETVSLSALFYVVYIINTLVFVGKFRNATFGDKIAGLQFSSRSYLRPRIVAREIFIITIVVLSIGELYHVLGLVIFLFPINLPGRLYTQLAVDVAFGLECQTVEQTITNVS